MLRQRLDACAVGYQEWRVGTLVDLEKGTLGQLRVVYRRAKDNAGARGEIPRANHEVSEGVCDQTVPVALDRLQDMRMVAENDVGAGVDEAPADILERLRRLLYVLVAGVQRQHQSAWTLGRAVRISAMIFSGSSVTL